MNKGYGVVFMLSLLLGVATQAGARIQQIDIQSFAFQPSTVTVSDGDSVRWTNLDAVQHSATSDSGPAAFDSGLLSQNQSYTHQFTVGGTYRYHCMIHTTMIGRVTVSTNGVEEGHSQAPGPGLSLLPSQPNPFWDQTRIFFQLPNEEPVSLEVYDLMGRRVATLVRGTLEAGSHAAVWDGRTASGEKAAPGAYLYRLEAGGRALTQKLVLLD